MTEKTGELQPNSDVLTARARANERWLTGSAEEHKQYDDLHIATTNNLRLYFANRPKTLDDSGIADRHDFTTREFRGCFERLKNERQELWLAAVQAAASPASNEYDQIESHQGDIFIDDMGRLLTEQAASRLQKDIIFSQVFDALVPILKDAQFFDPLIVCE